MTRKLGLVCMVFALMLGTLAACSGGNKAEDTVKGYFQAAKQFDGQAMAGYIVPSNTEDRSAVEEMAEPTEEENELGRYMIEYLKDNAGKMSFEIKSAKEEGDQAQVTVESRYIDGGPLMQEIMGEAITRMLGLAFTGEEPSDKESSNLFSEIIKEKTAAQTDQFRTETLEIPLVKHEDKWYISAVDKKMQDVVTSGFFSALEEMGSAFSE